MTGAPGFVSANKKSRPAGAGAGLTGPLTSPLAKTPPKKARRPKKPKASEGETGGPGLSNPLPASLLSISAPLPPTTLSPLKEPPPLPIRLPPGPGSPTPRVIHYAGRTGADNPTTPTWTVAVSRPVTASRPRPSTVQIQLPGLVRQHSPGGPDKLLIVMSPNKDQAGQPGGLIVTPGPASQPTPNKQA